MNKQKIIFFILESKKKCTESIYFKLLNKEARNNLKYEIIVQKTGTKISKDKILQIISIRNIKNIILVKDNDIKEYTEQNISKNMMEIKDILKLNTDMEISETSFIERYGIPNKNKTFDYFLLAHFNSEIFRKNKTKDKDKIENVLKELLGEKYKANEEMIKKVFKEDYLNNLEINLENFDEWYFKLFNLLFVVKKDKKK